jgi:hypothetical protein
MENKILAGFRAVSKIKSDGQHEREIENDDDRIDRRKPDQMLRLKRPEKCHCVLFTSLHVHDFPCNLRDAKSGFGLV